MKAIFLSLCLFLLVLNLVFGQDSSDQVLLIYKVKPLSAQKTEYQIKSFKIYFWGDKSRIEFVTMNPQKPSLQQLVIVIVNNDGEYSISEGNLEHDPFGVKKLAIFISARDSLYNDDRGLYEPIYCRFDWSEDQLKIGHLTAHKIILKGCEKTTKSTFVYTLKRPSIKLGGWFPEIQHVSGTPVQFNTSVANAPVNISVAEVKKMRPTPSLFKVPTGYKIVTARDALNFLKGHLH